MKWGVKIWDYRGVGSHAWCDWSPFTPEKRWSEDINQAYLLLNKVEYLKWKFSVEEYIT